MRTTLTLEPDVARKIQSKVKQNGKGLKEVINETLRLGLLEQEKIKAQPRKRFKVIPFPGRVRPGLNFDCTQQLLSQIEGEDRKW